MIGLPRAYSVNAYENEPLLDFIVDALRDASCALLHVPKPDTAPFRLSFQTARRERMGILAYAFRIRPQATPGHPEEVLHFEVGYEGTNGGKHEIRQDARGHHVTLLIGMDPELGFFVGADPALHDPIEFPTSIAFTQTQVDRIHERGFHAWEREPLSGRQEDAPLEVLVGGVPRAFLQYVLFERDALREDQEHRRLLADRVTGPISR